MVLILCLLPISFSYPCGVDMLVTLDAISTWVLVYVDIYMFNQSIAKQLQLKLHSYTTINIYYLSQLIVHETKTKLKEY